MGIPMTHDCSSRHARLPSIAKGYWMPHKIYNSVRKAYIEPLRMISISRVKAIVSDACLMN